MIVIEDAHDPRLADYRELKENRLREDSGKFIAESETVVRQLLASGLFVESILVTAPRLRSLAAVSGREALRPDIPVYLVPQAVMDDVAGLHVHRGCLAVGRRPRGPGQALEAGLLVALEDLVDVDNVGAIVRHAAAFGAQGVLLSPRAADPYYRKAIRVAMGNTFKVPIRRLTTWPDDLLALKQSAGARLVGTVVEPEGAKVLAGYAPHEASIVVFGAEGPGLSPALRAACDDLLTIPMGAADSLNVATAAAICLYHFTQVAPQRDRRRAP
ncbi:MAG: RNA methyltransferase [Myxococcales bacterium]|nr:RNA methyltransferase [Myxococcales bacterium]